MVARAQAFMKRVFNSQLARAQNPKNIIFDEKWRWTDWKGRNREITAKRDVKSEIGLEEINFKGVDPSFVRVVMLDELCGRLEDLELKIDKMNSLLESVVSAREEAKVN